MKRNFRQILKDFKGVPILSGPLTQEGLQRVLTQLSPEALKEVADAMLAEKIVPLTLEAVCCQALGAEIIEEKNPQTGASTVQAAERMKRWRLGLLIVCPESDGTVDISPEQRDLIKALLPKVWGGSIIAPQAMEMLEGPSPEAVAEKAA